MSLGADNEREWNSWNYCTWKASLTSTIAVPISTDASTLKRLKPPTARR
jgi:hypothetical protein